MHGVSALSRYRWYQANVANRCIDAWNGSARVVAPVMPTGSGKTVVIAGLIKTLNKPTCAIAHRQELVTQISTALAREGVRHSFIADKQVIKSAVAGHMEELGRSYYDPTSSVKVAGIDTLVRRASANDPWFASVGLAVIDEGHHVLQKNKWGTGFEMFPNALGLFPTATFCRADGQGLGRCSDGYVEEIIEGPPMRALIDMGYLTDYDVVCPKPSVDLHDVNVSDATGDFNQFQVRKAVHDSPKLVGDVVHEYLRWAKGKLGVTFAVDVESANEIAQAYRAAGVPAEVVTAKTHDDLRRSILRRFKRREILQLVNVDLFGEGFDLPAIEVVSMARPTQSFPLYCQQAGRAMRLMISPILMAAWDTYDDAQRRRFIAESDKPKALIIDHVGNIERHGLPDRPRVWSLERREKRAKVDSDEIPLRRCLNTDVNGTGLACLKDYERYLRQCPYCGHRRPEPTSRSSMESVEGDLVMLDPALLAAMRGEVIQLDSSPKYPYGASPAIRQSIWNRHVESCAAQRDLRHVMDCWSAAHDDDDSTNYRRFYVTFGLDVVSAMGLGAREAAALRERIERRLAIDGYVIRPQAVPVPSESRGTGNAEGTDVERRARVG